MTKNKTQKNVTPSYFLPDGDELLAVKELAEKLRRTERYVRAMVADGFKMPGGRATANQALQWLIEHPEFRVNRRLPRPRKSGPKDIPGQTDIMDFCTGNIICKGSL